LTLAAFRRWQACGAELQDISAIGTVVNDPGSPPDPTYKHAKTPMIALQAESG